MNLLIKNGIIIDSNNIYKSDIYIVNEKIDSIGKNIKVKTSNIIDADNCYILPGFIDVHTHFNIPFFDTFSSDDFFSGSIALATGGTTFFIDYICPDDDKLVKAADLWFEKSKYSIIDYSFHCIIKQVTKNTYNDMKILSSNGITSFKIFSAYPNFLLLENEKIFQVLKYAKELNSLVCFHAETGEVIQNLISDSKKNGFTSPINHFITRPEILELEAIERIIKFADLLKTSIYIVHLSSINSLNKIILAKKKGLNIFTESCPQYLVFDSTEYCIDNFYSSKFVMSPPLRNKYNKNELWKAIRNNNLNIISTDHCSFFLNDQKIKSDFSKIPNGVALGQYRAILLYNYGVLTKKITLNKWIDILSVYPSKLFGLYPKKGAILPGSDADIVIFNPNKKSIFFNNSNTDFNDFSNFSFLGLIEAVFSRGKLIFKKNKISKNIYKHGTFVKRKKVNFDLF